MATAAPTSMDELVERYGAAWNSHDVEAILDLHADDTTFQLHLAGFPRANGLGRVRAQFEQFFATWASMHFETTDLHVCDHLFVHAFRFSADLAAPITVGGVPIEPAGQQVSIDGVDVITTAGLKVVAKETYMDGVALVGQLQVSPSRAAA